MVRWSALSLLCFGDANDSSRAVLRGSRKTPAYRRGGLEDRGALASSIWLCESGARLVFLDAMLSVLTLLIFAEQLICYTLATASGAAVSASPGSHHCAEQTDA